MPPAVRTAFILLCFLFTSLPADAHQTAGLTGTVTDPSGGAIVGARVAVVGPESRSATTDQAGRFSIAPLPQGGYTLRVEADGFSPASRTVRVAATGSTIDVVLAIAGVEDTIVVGAQRLGSRVPLEPRLPGSFDTVDRLELERTHTPSVNEAIRKVPGVVARDEEGFGLRPNIALRGLNPTRSSKVLLLEDGIPLTFAPYGDNASYYHPPIERFDGIEVLKGSGQVAYGPSTIGGVINYLTPMPPARPAGTLSLAGGNRSFFDGVATFGSSRGPVGFFVDGMRKQGDGARDHTHSRLSDFNGKLVVTVSPAQVLTAKGTYYRERSQVTYSGLRQAEYDASPRQNAFRNDSFSGDRAALTLSHHAAPADRLMIASTAYVAEFTRHWWRQSSNSAQRPNDAADPNCGGMANLLTTCGNEGRLRRYTSGGVESRVRVRWNALGETEFGGRLHAELQDRRQENGETPVSRSGIVVENNERRARAASAFAQHRLAWRNAVVTPGVRIEHMAFERTNRLGNAGAGARGETSLTQVIPGVGASVNFGGTAVVFGGIHRGFAPPRVEDVIGNAGGIVDLDAELSWNGELGVRSRPADALRLDATWFLMEYENQIVPASLAGGVGAALTNGGSTRHHGVEISARAETPRGAGARHGGYAKTAYTFIPVARFTGVRTSAIGGFQGVSVSGNRLPYAPEHLAALTLGYTYARRIDTFVELVSTSAQFSDDLNTLAPTPDGQRGRIPAVHTWNAGLNVRIAGGVTLFGAVYNAADRLYIADRSRGILPGPPRRMQFGAKAQF